MQFDVLTALVHDDEMRAIFSEDATIAAWLKVEVAIATAQAELGIIEDAAARAVAEAATVDSIDCSRLWEVARVVGYPILPLVRQLDARMPAEHQGTAHYGATTQDIMDSGLALQLVAATDRLGALLDRLGETLSEQVAEHTDTVMAARTHDLQAVPTTLGAKLGVYLAEFARHRDRLSRARSAVGVVSLHGAGGTSAAYGPKAGDLRERVASSLGLRSDAVPWHVARDGIAEWGHVAAAMTATCGRFAREVIALSRTEVGEVSEGAGHLRGASSTMPQKANPITSEMVVGLASVTESLGSLLYRIMQPGHDRSAGEWQAEWWLLPTLACHAAAALESTSSTVTQMRVDSRAMARNLEADHGLVMSEAYMMRLAPRLGRERAHELIYRAARQAREDRVPLFDAVTRLLPPETENVEDLRPESYLGQAGATAKAAVDRWRAGRAVLATETIATCSDVVPTRSSDQQEGEHA